MNQTPIPGMHVQTVYGVGQVLETRHDGFLVVRLFPAGDASPVTGYFHPSAVSAAAAAAALPPTTATMEMENIDQTLGYRPSSSCVDGPCQQAMKKRRTSPFQAGMGC
uniref:Uncharacterized protein n=1 Tax=Heterosigma akashiwo TaxID=2829 RepID=A0A6V1NCA3_HETAK|mmetsp:Transcript_29602/g.43668  ORF Transcript_29602/g.43668 Transcript_29602/m.43668 type:complete len:108 (+) Transcript_29602:68-391(+)